MGGYELYANQKVLENLNVEKILEHYGFNTDTNSSGDIIRTNCKIHGGTNPTAFAINRDTGLWFCHTNSCGGGDIFHLIEKLENVDFYKSVDIISNILDVDVNGMKVSKIKTKNEKEVEIFIKAIKSSHTSPFKAFSIDTDTNCIAKYRSFLKGTIDHFKMVFVKEIELEKKDGSKYKLFNRLLFPIIVEGVQIGISLRRTKSTDFPKWSHQPRGIKTEEVLYNIDSVVVNEPIIVVEGILDVWAFYEIGLNAVCVFGSHITNIQYSLLLKLGSDLVFAFDGDEAGRNATQKAIQMFKNKANMSMIEFNEGEDPENITREELRKRYEGRKICV